MRAIVSKLKRKLRKDDTAERCGLVLQDGTVCQVENMHQKPENGFAIAAKYFMRHEGEILGTWHTHPYGKSVLSMEDNEGFLQWPQLIHFIVGRDGVRGYRVDDGLVREVDLASG